MLLLPSDDDEYGCKIFVCIFSQGGNVNTCLPLVPSSRCIFYERPSHCNFHQVV